MLGPRALSLAFIVCVGCSRGSGDDAPTPSQPNQPTGGDTPQQPPTPELPPAPSMEGALDVPAVKVLQGADACPETPSLPASASPAQRALAPALEALRSISCHPDVLGMATPAIRERLSTPASVSLRIGRRHAEVELGEPVAVADIVATLQLADAKMRLEQSMAPTWRVVSGPDATPLRPWGVGEVEIRIAGDRHEDASSGTVSDIPADASVSSIFLTFGDDVLSFENDEHAAAAAVGALVEIANEPALLKEDETKAHALLPMLGERYRLSRFSVGMGEEERLGFSLRPHRTELSAAELAQGLGLRAPHHESISITDANPNRLADGKHTEIPWHGLSLEIELDEAEGLGLQGWTVDSIEVLPAEQ